MGIGKRIKERRKLLNLRQGELAAAAGISQGVLSRLEKEENVKSKELIEIANALKVNALWLKTGEGSPDLPEPNPILRELTKLIESTDARGQEKILLAAKDALDAHNAWQNSLTNIKNIDVAAIAKELRQEAVSKVVKAETSSDVCTLEPDAREGKHH